MFFHDTGWNGRIDWRCDAAIVADPGELSAEPFAVGNFHSVAGPVMI
jgi:hypothetical protein